MRSAAKLKKEANRGLKAAWVTLGMPFDLPMIEEKAEGIIDVEALILVTMMVMEKDRMATDLPAWINRFSSLIHFQKLKSIFRGLPKEHRSLIVANLNQGLFGSTHQAFKDVFGLRVAAAGGGDASVELRTSKINTIENVAQVSLMIRNRLIYGTGFRADLITLTHIENMRMKGTELARLLYANSSTVSRILNDLKASRFLNQDAERMGSFESYPRMFLSVLSVRNFCELMDAARFSRRVLKEGALDALNFKHDGFGLRISKRRF